ncbi:hypothetical protein [Notoacmeibacter sp. MSK16QG-6]|uniref:hypothetical protein n=1 Tax=Notoacmeibacter sp. MSK16QG-6 TaxID=2957982 RepID=UPI0020A1EB19|nr:hypothetical protein [Notoacmeibacter sp. MSK16QG-6]MCP1199744.1 hypothetical protein [Notoacmeibacter sp. MSK16QG-6]
MGSIIALLTSLSTEELSVRLDRAKRLATAYAIAGVLGLLAMACLLTAAIVYVGQIYGPVVAALAIAGVLIGLAILIVIAASIMNAAAMRRRKAQRAARQSAMIGAAVPLVPMIVKSRILFGLTAAAGSAYLAARYFEVGPFRDDR